MDNNDTQYAEWWFLQEEECLGKSPVELLREPLEELKMLNLQMEFMIKYVTNTMPKAKTEQEKMAEFSFNELTK